MKEKRKKFVLVLTLVTTLILSIFAVFVTQYNIRFVKSVDADEGPDVKVFADKIEGTVPFTVNFSSVITEYDGDIAYEWNLGNGNTSKEKQPKVLYQDPGEYTCTLSVTDDGEKTKTDTIKITAKRNKPPVVTLSINQNTINREFNWLEILSLTPIAAYAGNQALILDVVENKKGADAWGEGRIVVKAQILDPEDDEIVSYDWKVQKSETVVTSPLTGSKEWLPSKNLTGEKSVTIPELYAWMDKQHIVILTVTDSAGNKATADIQFTVSQSLKLTKIKNYKDTIKTGLPLLGMLWGLQFVEKPVTKGLDEIWFDLTPTMQNLILKTLGFLDWDYEPPSPKANLVFSAIDNINLSTYVNNSGVVQSGASVRSDFTISNNDSLNIAEAVYITLDNPFSDDNGLPEDIEVEDLIVDLNVNVLSNKLFNNGQYTNWQKCYNIDKLSSGDFIKLGVTVTLNEGAIFNKGSYPCNLYIYQDGALDGTEYVDEIPFTIVI